MKLASRCLLLLLISVVLTGVSFVDSYADEPAKDAKLTAQQWQKLEAERKKKEAEPKTSVTQHQATIDGNEIKFTATAGKLVMKSDSGDPKANVFFVAYTKDNDSSAPSKRPITFCFNGGPGSSSVWLHLGMLGPTRVKLTDDATPTAPPHQLIPNPYSLLDTTDLVFIDPVSTGYSRPAKGENKKQFHGYDEDLRSMAQFIHDYTNQYRRWASPKFLLGESYGGLRVAGLSGRLKKRYRMDLNGVILISAVIDFQTLRANLNNDIAYALFLPSYTATAWYHDALSKDQQDRSVAELVQEAKEFARGPYLQALLAGDGLAEETRDQVAAKMSELTGLSKEYLSRSRLRVDATQFRKELLREKALVLGRFDSRYAGLARDQVSESPSYDPSAAAVFGPFTSSMNEYLREQLKVEEEQVYEILTGNVHPWDYSKFTNQFVNASTTLRQTMIENPHLNVFAACGYYDLATPLFAMEHSRDHLGLPAERRSNITTKFYEGGHMMYVHEPSLKKLRGDLLEFYAASIEAIQKPTIGESDGESKDEQ